MREAADGARVRAGGPAARPADHRAQGHRAPADGGRPQRGPRRDRHRRGRARGRGAGVLRPPGPGGRAQGLRARQGRGPRRRASWSAASSRTCTTRTPPLGVPKQVLVPVEPDDLDALRGVAAPLQRGSRVDDPGAAAGRQAGAAGDGHPQRQGGVHPPPPAAGQRPQQPGRALNELQEHLGLPEAPLRIECYDMSHIQGTDYVGSMVVLEDGLPKKSRVPAVQGRTCRATTTSRPWRRCSPGGSPPTSPSGDKPRGRARRASSPTRRSCCSSTAARASSAWPCGCVRELGPRRRDPRRRAGQAVRGGLRAGRRPTRSASRGSPRRCTCCSASATRPTASPSPTTASCAASG